jgi:hypothetical protein
MGNNILACFDIYGFKKYETIPAYALSRQSWELMIPQQLRLWAAGEIKGTTPPSPHFSVMRFALRDWDVDTGIATFIPSI